MIQKHVFVRRFVANLPALLCVATSALAENLPQIDMNLPEGFIAEQVYEVPNAQQGSWISMTVDDQGRLITSDQSGGLYRLTVRDQAVTVEAIDVPLGMAMGLLHVNDTLYVMVNGHLAEGPGLYAVNDSDGDDRYDKIRLLRGIVSPGKPGAGHGNHAIVLGPDKTSLYLICGNMAGVPVDDFDSSRVPRNWDEDQLLPRLMDSHGHAAKTMAPGGWIAKTDLDGRHWELVCSGFRNIYDAAFNREGDLFTFDADMEFDIGTPWYRPTRICHVVSGGEFGWRNGSGKWPVYSPDSLSPAVDIGPGSPTGVTFGYDTNFPEPFRKMLFLCDWSYGRIYVANVARQGASYSGQHQLFASRSPLPVTDIVANRHDGALYFVTGGRGVQSHVYRIRYKGPETTAKPAESVATPRTDRLHRLRKQLEGLHQRCDSKAVDELWPHLGHSDRHIRFAARIALEHQPIASWRKRALSYSDVQTQVTAAIALSRCGDQDAASLITALLQHRFEDLSESLQLEFLRACALSLIRQGDPGEELRKMLGQTLLAEYPSSSSTVNRELCRLLAALQPAGTIGRSLELLESSELPEDQIHFAAMLRTIDKGWSIEERRRYFQWLLKSREYAGGRSNGEFTAQIQKDAEAALSKEHRTALAGVLRQFSVRSTQDTTAIAPRPIVQKWKVTDLIASRDTTWANYSGIAKDDRQGRTLFATASCNRCHRVKGQGGVVGPDLTSISRRFSPHDVLEAIIEPARTVPNEYQSVSVITTDGKVVTGQIVNLSNKSISLRTDALAPANLTNVPQDQIEEIASSKTSLMPAGLLDSLDPKEVRTLLVWLARQSSP